MAERAAPGRHDRETATDPLGPLGRLRADLVAALPSWLAARALVALAFLLARAVTDHWVPGATTPALSSGLYAWDGSFYRDLADFGYRALPPDALRFFPLFPVAGRVLGFGQGSALALVVLANVASLVAAVVMRRLVISEGRSTALADRAVWVTNLFPASFVLVWAYAEAIFLVFALGTFFAARRRHFGLAALLAFLAALTRPVGLVLAAPIAIEALRRREDDSASLAARGARLSAAFAPVAGFGAYLLWVGHNFGDALAPLTVQSTLRGTSDPVTRVFRGFGDVFGKERFGDGLHIPFVVLFLLLLVVVWRRWPSSYSVYATLVLVVALSAENLNSVERYALNAFPLLIAVAEITSTRRREHIGLAVCGCGLLALCSLAWLTVYVP